MLLVVGRAGIGKTVLVTRILKELAEQGHLPDGGLALSVKSVIYSSARGENRLDVPNLYADLLKLLPDDEAAELDDFYKNAQVPISAKIEMLLEAFPLESSDQSTFKPTILLLDNFETLLDPETQNLIDAELDEALKTLLNTEGHSLKVILTTRIAPYTLSTLPTGRRVLLPLEAGLPPAEAETMLRLLDQDGLAGLRQADAALLIQAAERTQGYPRALEALHAILVADRTTSLTDFVAAEEELLPETVVEVLIGEAFNRLDLMAQQVMQTLAIFNRPVTTTPLNFVLQAYYPALNSEPILRRLVNMQFVRYDAKRFNLHPTDRAYAWGRIKPGVERDRLLINRNNPPFTRFALYHLGAEYFKKIRKPSQTWQTIKDLAPQLAEFELRYAGQDYETAAELLLDIDFDYLRLWGHYRLMAQLHERLQDKLMTPELRGYNLTSLGIAYHSMNQLQKSMTCFEQGLTLARTIKNLGIQDICLTGLGNCYLGLGQTKRAIEYHKQAMSVDRKGESAGVGNLGLAYANLGQTKRAIDHFQQALAIHRESGDELNETINLGNLAEVLIDEGRYAEARQYAADCIKIAAELNTPYVLNHSYGFMALAHLYSADLTEARTAIETARQFSDASNNHNILVLLGIIAWSQGDAGAAVEAFQATITYADKLLGYSSQNYEALDAKGLALCGLALSETVTNADFKAQSQLKTAGEAFQAARSINSDAGIVGRVLRLFDVLAKGDEADLLAPVRLRLFQFLNAPKTTNSPRFL